jgi:hypothetical protein
MSKDHCLFVFFLTPSHCLYRLLMCTVISFMHDANFVFFLYLSHRLSICLFSSLPCHIVFTECLSVLPANVRGPLFVYSLPCRTVFTEYLNVLPYLSCMIYYLVVEGCSAYKGVAGEHSCYYRTSRRLQMYSLTTQTYSNMKQQSCVEKCYGYSIM